MNRKTRETILENGWEIVTYWDDHETKSWWTYAIDAEGKQLRDATFHYHLSDAMEDHQDLVKELS